MEQMHPQTPEEKLTDVFEEDWQDAKEYWKRKHSIYDFAYLQYRSILTFNNLWGQDYLNAFGMSVYVPYTFQAIESISASINSRKIEILVESLNKNDEKKEKYLQALDNAEWVRTKMDNIRAEANKNALIFGNGYYFNPFVDDTRTYHFAETKQESEQGPQDTEDAMPQQDEPTLPENKNKIKWVQKKITRYRGMKPRSLDPYYVFPDPNATSNEDWQYCYTYTVMTVKQLRDFVVSSGWMSEEEARAKIVQGPEVEHFDAIRDTMDVLFSYTSGSWGGRKDGTTQAGTTRGVPPLKRNQVALIERFEEDGYEARIAGINEPIYKDYNVYPHKKIPIVPVWDTKIPNEFMGMGEPEIMRWQQIESNRIHNSVLDALLMSTVQRYAIRADLLEDETDVSFWNPFKPIRLKNLPGLTNVNNAIMPMAQPDVKQSPFQLMELVKQTMQQTSGASDFVVSGNNSSTDTATESNNLVAATSNRMKEKTRQMDEVSIPYIIEQWHACYPMFYTEAMDFRLTGEKGFSRFIPLDKTEANTDEGEVEKARKLTGALGDTLEQVYQNAGYKMIVFLSDTVGGFNVKIEMTDLEMNADKEIKRYVTALDLFARINQDAASQGETKRFDVWKLGQKAVKTLPMIRDTDDFVKSMPMQLPQMPGAPMPTDAPVNEQQPVAPTPQQSPELSTPPPPAPQEEIGAIM